MGARREAFRARSSTKRAASRRTRALYAAHDFLCTHLGHPSVRSHSHDDTMSMASRTSSGKILAAREAMPTPPR